MQNADWQMAVNLCWDREKDENEEKKPRGERREIIPRKELRLCSIKVYVCSIHFLSSSSSSSSRSSSIIVVRRYVAATLLPDLHNFVSVYLRCRHRRRRIQTCFALKSVYLKSKPKMELTTLQTNFHRHQLCEMCHRWSSVFVLIAGPRSRRMRWQSRRRRWTVILVERQNLAAIKIIFAFFCLFLFTAWNESRVRSWLIHPTVNLGIDREENWNELWRKFSYLCSFVHFGVSVYGWGVVCLSLFARLWLLLAEWR